MQISNVIKNVIVTEKSMGAKDAQNRYHFKVNMKASKGAVAEAVTKLFNVEVIDVKTFIMPGKPKRVMRTKRFIKTPKWKKAIVRVKDGQEIKLVSEGK